MPIEFRCIKCDRLLRTPDGTVGKSAKCPQCGTVTIVPEARPTPPPPPPDPQSHMHPGLRDTSVPGDAGNPFRSPAAHGLASSGANVDRGYRPSQIDMGDVLGRTWEIFKQNFAPCFVAGLIFLIAAAIGGGIVGGIFAAITSQLDGIASVAASVLHSVAIQAVIAFLFVGMIVFMLRVARGQPVDYSAIFSGGPLVVPAVAVLIIAELAFLGGFMLLIVPGIVIGLMLSQSLFMLVDQGADVPGALRKSVEVTDGNKWTLFATFFVVQLLSTMACAITCGLAAVLVIPYMILLAAVVYLGLTGQRTAVDLFEQPASERGFGPAGA